MCEKECVLRVSGKETAEHIYICVCFCVCVMETGWIEWGDGSGEGPQGSH